MTTDPFNHLGRSASAVPSAPRLRLGARASYGRDLWRAWRRMVARLIVAMPIAIPVSLIWSTEAATTAAIVVGLAAVATSAVRTTDASLDRFFDEFGCVGLVNETRALVGALKGDLSAVSYIAPHRQRLRVPRDIELMLDIPVEVRSPTSKIVYALYREGEQCYCNLRMLTGLSETELAAGLRLLIHHGRVVKHTTPQVLPEMTEANHFSLRGAVTPCRS